MTVPSSPREIPRFNRWDIWALIIIVGTTLVRTAFVMSGQLDLVQDECQYWDWSRRLQLSYFTKGPLVAYIIAGGTEIFGNTPLGVRIGAILGFMGFQIVLYLGISRLMLRPFMGFLALAVVNSMLLFMTFAFMMTTDNPLMLCWLGAFFSVYAMSLGDRGVWPAVALFFCCAVGVLAKYTMLLFLPLALLYGISLARRGIKPKGYFAGVFGAGILGTAAGFAPIVWWNHQNDYVGLKHILHLSGVAGEKAKTFFDLDKFPEFVFSQIGILLPWWFVFLMIAGAMALGVLLAGPRKDRSKAERLSDREACFLAWFFWPVWGFFCIWSLHTRVNANWPAVSLAAGLLLIAAFWEKRLAKAGPYSIHRWLWPGLGLVMFLALHVHDFLPVPYRFSVDLPVKVPGVEQPLEFINPTLRLKGWRDLGREVESLRRNNFANPEKVFIFSDNYDVTASLAFYTPGNPVTYCVDMGRRKNQYDLWPGPQDKVGWDAIFVRQKFKKGVPEVIQGMFASVERREYESEHKGNPARRFTIYVCKGFRGNWPKALGGGY
jgi:4-amino-4-deoxy-L-arabinose transferase-like glycosyltransferase